MAKAVQPVRRRSWSITACIMICGLAAGLAASLPFSTASAAGRPSAQQKHTDTPQHKLNLFTKNPVTWQIIHNGPSGTLCFTRESGAFSFTAERLQPTSTYVLVRHIDSATRGDLLAQGTANQVGRLQLSGTWSEWSGKIWLVPGADVAVSGKQAKLLAWHPEQILFEEKVLGIACECDH